VQRSNFTGVGLIFCVQHLPMPKIEDKADDWITLQLRGTQNVTTGFWADWFTGHLNYQIEHHLFPNMPRHSYPYVAARVKALCAKHGVPYNQTTIWGSCVDVVNQLALVAKQYKTALDGSK
jgi:fatty acid desaturase